MVAVRKRKQVTYNESDSDFMSDEEVVRSNSKKPTTKKPTNTKKKAKREVVKESTTEEEEQSEDKEESEEEEKITKKSTKKKPNTTTKKPAPKPKKNNQKEERIYDFDSTVKSKLVIPRPKGSPFADAISPDALEFLAELAENNDRDFMHLKAKEWASVKKDFTDFCGLVMKDIHEVDPTVLMEEAKKSVYRQNRDLRFSNDKRPYKTNLSASFSRTGKKFIDAGYFLSIRPGGESIIAAGIWQPGKESLENIRQGIIRNGDLFREAISTDAIINVFDGKSGIDIMEDSDKLKNGPKGIEKDHPEIELLKFRSFVIRKKFTDEEVVSPGFLDKVVDVVEAVVPFVAVINSWV